MSLFLGGCNIRSLCLVVAIHIRKRGIVWDLESVLSAVSGYVGE